MVTLDIRHTDEEITKVEAPEPVDAAIDQSNKIDQAGDEKSSWSYSVPFPGVRYYSFGGPRPAKTPGNAASAN